MIYLTLIISFIFSNYQLGETISESDQNINFNKETSHKEFTPLITA